MRGAWLVVVALAGSARADEVKVGPYTLSSSSRGVEVRRGKRTAPLFVPERVLSLFATLDPKTKRVTIDRESECSKPSDTMTLDALEARLVNVEALALHHKKDFAGAAAGFAKAVALDPTWRLPALNLASAQARQGHTAEAIAALAPWLAADPVGVYAQVAIDADLQPLLATPELRAVPGRTPAGALALAKTGELPDKLAYSAARGWIAVDHADISATCEFPQYIHVLDAKTGAMVTRISLGTSLANEMMCQGAHSNAEVKAAEQAIAGRAAALGPALAAFGFSPVANAEHANAEDVGDGGQKRAARFPKAKLGAAWNGGAVNILSGNKTLATGTISETRFTGATYLPDAHAMVLYSHRPSDVCAGDGEDVVAIPDKR